MGFADALWRTFLSEEGTRQACPLFPSPRQMLNSTKHAQQPTQRVFRAVQSFASGSERHTATFPPCVALWRVAPNNGIKKQFRLRKNMEKNLFLQFQRQRRRIPYLVSGGSSGAVLLLFLELDSASRRGRGRRAGGSGGAPPEGGGRTHHL